MGMCWDAVYSTVGSLLKPNEPVNPELPRSYERNSHALARLVPCKINGGCKSPIFECDCVANKNNDENKTSGGEATETKGNEAACGNSWFNIQNVGLGVLAVGGCLAYSNYFGNSPGR